MRVEFDRSANPASIYLREIGPGAARSAARSSGRASAASPPTLPAPGEAARRHQVDEPHTRGTSVLDLDDGRPVEIEVLDATGELPREVLEGAERIGR